MASSAYLVRFLLLPASTSDLYIAKLHRPPAEDQPKTDEQTDAGTLPQTLVRIPTEHAPALQAQTEAALEEEPTT